MSPEPSLLVTTEDHVANVTINRPEKRNAIDLELFEALGNLGQVLGDNPKVRAVVLSGTGGHFSAGIDTSLFSSADPATLLTMLQPVSGSPANVFQRAAWIFRELQVPVICAIEGTAFGAGLQIALGADVRLATTDARLSVMEISWGIIPDLAISATTRGLVRSDHLRELVYTGRVVAGEEARELGLVTRTCQDPVAEAKALAAKIAGHSPSAIRNAKRLLQSAWDLPVDEALSLEARLQAELLGGSDQAEVVRARLAGREPEFGS